MINYKLNNLLDVKNRIVLNKVVMVSKNLSGIKDLTGLALPILGLPKIVFNPLILNY